MTALSVIVPVHNGERYLEACLESILGQTWGDFELLCVDDGSTDGTLTLLERYAAQDERLRVIRREAEGAGAARNAGMAQAHGEYLFFLDADDFFLPDMFRCAWERAREAEADIVLLNGRRYDQTTGKEGETLEFLYPDLLPPKAIFCLDDAPETFFRITTPAPWSKLFKASFVRAHGLQFQNLPNSNDLLFVYMALALAERVTAAEGDYIRYRVNTNCGTQDTRHRDPLCFTRALDAWWCALCEAGMAQRAERAFVNTALSVVKYNIETVRGASSREAILDYLDTPSRLCAEVLERPNEFYAFFDSQQLRRFILAARKQRARMRMAHAPVAFELVGGERRGADPAVSVIVPVYNALPYVRETIASLQAQTFRDLEIICVNDGSTDGSLEELVALAREDGRIRVLNQPNQGLSRSRNVGLEEARGTYVYFMDSDDLLMPQALEELVRPMEEQSLDLLYFDAESFFESEQLRRDHPWFINSYTRTKEYGDVYNGADLLALFQGNGDYIVSACMYVARRDLVERCNLRFIPGIMHEDNAFTFSLGIAAKRASHRKRAFFRRRVHTGSIMTTCPSFAKSYGYFVCGREMARQLALAAGQLDHEAQGQLETLVSQAFQNARNVYLSLSEEEREARFGLSEERGAFAIEVEGPAEALRRARDELVVARTEIEALRRSLSFRLGRAVTKPMRWFRDVVAKTRGEVG